MKSVCLFYEVYKSLGLNEFFEKTTVFLHVLHIVRKVEDLICTVSSRIVFACNFLICHYRVSVWVVKVFKRIDQKDQKVQELLLDFKCKLFPKYIFW